MTAPDSGDEFPKAGRFARSLTGGLFLSFGLIASLSVVVFSGQLRAEPNRAGVWLFVVFSAWLAFVCLLFAYRLLFNRPSAAGGLMSPAALRLGALFFGGLPIISFATGAWRNNNFSDIAVFSQGITYLGISAALFRLAQKRSESKR